MSAQTLWLRTDSDRHQIRMAIAKLPLAGGAGYKVTIREADKRTLDMNAAMWAKLTDVSRQVEWHDHWLAPEEWKDVFTAALRKSKVVPGIDGGFVVVGAHTSQMTRSEMSELLALIDAFGDEHGVKWSAPKWAQEAYAT